METFNKRIDTMVMVILFFNGFGLRLVIRYYSKLTFRVEKSYGTRYRRCKCWLICFECFLRYASLFMEILWRTVEDFFF